MILVACMLLTFVFEGGSNNDKGNLGLPTGLKKEKVESGY